MTLLTRRATLLSGAATLLAACATQRSTSAISIPPGTGTFQMAGGARHRDTQITVHYHRPAGYGRRSPILIVLPGIFLMIRWMMAPAILVGRGVSPTKALGESWERTRGNEFSIFGAAFTILIAMIIIRIVSSALFDDKNLVGIIVTQIAANTTSLVIQAMGVALYGMIGGAQPVAPAAA